VNGAGVGTSAPGWGHGAQGERDDRALIQAHVDGDPTAFAELFRRHRDRLWAVAMRTLGDREEASDALQDAMVSAFRNAGSYRGEAAVTTWLHRVVVNACLDRVRRRQARPSVSLGETEVPSQRDDHGATEARLDVHHALARLPESQRLAIVLVDLQDLSVAAAAAVLGVAEGTVKSRCSRGRTELARLLRSRLPEVNGGRRSPPAEPSTQPGNLAAPPRVAPPGRWANDSPGPATSGGAQ
jgi:RNA polymerase sigma-70 factor (ECF subfamily)